MKTKPHDSNIFIKKCIAEALIKLLQKKELDSISITELVKVAGVSRMAYYRNFTSKEEVISSYSTIILQEYEEKTKCPSEGKYLDMHNTIHYFSFLKKHQEFLKVLVKHSYLDFFSDTASAFMVDKWKIKTNNKKEYYKFLAFSGSLYLLYFDWAENDFQESPEEMAKMLFALSL